MADEQDERFGTNLWLVDEMYRDYLADPDSVAPSWQDFFADYRPAWQTGDRAPVARSNGGGARNGSAPSPDGSRTAEPEAPGAAPSAASDGAGTRTESGAAGTQQATTGEPVPEDASRLRGASNAIAENMIASLQVPTATSFRDVPAKLLEVNRRILNNQLRRTRGGKLSFTHLIGWAIVRAMSEVPAMRQSFLLGEDGKGYVRRPEHVNLGLAVDVEKSDGSRTLLVPNIKEADTHDFAGFFGAYEDVIRKIKRNELSPDLFANTTATLTNPGTLGTVGSVPRLMDGQSVIIGVGAIGFPAEYKAADPRTLAELGVGKVITLTSTYDHRVIQGAESGLFLQRIEQLLLGEHGFYDEVFSSLRVPYEPVRWRVDDNPRVAARSGDNLGKKQIQVQQLINMYRVRGHLIANLNPLQHTFKKVHPELDPATYGLTIWDLDREFLTDSLSHTEAMPLGDILGVLRDAYCRTVGVEYMHIQEPEQKRWIQDRVEGKSWSVGVDEQRRILDKLNRAEAFERFLHTKFLGQKRFSLEGAESLIPMLDVLLSSAADDDVAEAILGMAHRGRLNVLSNIVGKSHKKIFSEFEGDVSPDTVQGSGDVKYHLGTTGRHTSPAGHEIRVHMSANPSHLEAVDPVVVGMARARMDQRGDDRVLPILIHGDAAFAGQGVVAETLSMSQLDGYQTGGTVHIVVNNQLGFTTAPHQGRSSEYATDVAKTVQAPIFHVNGDDPEACARVVRLALAFRQTFGKDVVVDMVCYRRHGHNEGDEPSYTQPIMYAAIENRRSVRKVYTEELVNRGDLTVDEAEESMESFRALLDDALEDTRESAPPSTPVAAPPEVRGVLPRVETGVERDRLDAIVKSITSWPEGFTVHPKLGRQFEKRRNQLADDAADWATGEALAFGSLVLDGVPVRLTGQDSRRGTFSQRHSVLVDYTSGDEWIPLANLSDDQAPFQVYDSPLNEFASMGFEYGYSVQARDTLTLWEAQFGDFVNGAQVVIDQFIAAAEDKWHQTSGLVLLLPHGYEGQGPEHSSARIERFLTLAAEDNIQVAQPSTAAQYFHLLRRQMLREVRTPLIVFSPKGMLRSKAAASPASAFTSGSFIEVIDDPSPPDEVQRVVLCSGKIAHELAAERDRREAPAAIVRVEQLYPWPGEQIREIISGYANSTDVYWVQDEPENMGPWPFVHGRLHRIVKQRTLRHRSRIESASPATGSHTVHDQEHEQLMDEAFEDL